MDIASKIYITCEAIIGGLTIFGNSLVLIAIYKNSRLQTVTNCFIASLALADLSVGIVVAPLAALSSQGLPYNFYGCVFTNSIVVSFTQVSIFNLLAVACERFIAIKHPFQYTEHLTIKRAKIINLCVWIIGMFFGLIPLFGWNLRHLQDEDWTCNFVTVIDMRYVVYFHFFGCIVVPLILIVLIYSYIFYVVRKQMSQIAATEITSYSNNKTISNASGRFKREIKAAKSLAMVIILFAFCWIPIHVLNSITLMCSTCTYPLELLLVTIVISHANSAINPLLYAYGNSNFRVAFKKMLCPNGDEIDNWMSNLSTAKMVRSRGNANLSSEQANEFPRINEQESSMKSPAHSPNSRSSGQGSLQQTASLTSPLSVPASRSPLHTANINASSILIEGSAEFA